MRTAFIRALLECARKDERIFLITADLGYSVLEEFERAIPGRFLNVGIAEQNAVGTAAGLAMSGRTVFVYSIVPFATMRCFEQVRVDVAYLQTNVKLVGVGGGLSYGPAGATHHSIEDISIMRTLPNMTVVCPGDPLEASQLVPQLASHKGPCYLRLGKNGEPLIHAPGTKIQMGRSVVLREGRDLTLIATGNMLETAAKAASALAADGIQAEVISMHTVKPLDTAAIVRAAEKGAPIFSLEEHSLIGGLGSSVAEVLAELGRPVQFKRIAFPDLYTHEVGSQGYLRAKYGLDDASVVEHIRKVITS